MDVSASPEVTEANELLDMDKRARVRSVVFELVIRAVSDAVAVTVSRSDAVAFTVSGWDAVAVTVSSETEAVLAVTCELPLAIIVLMAFVAIEAVSEPAGGNDEFSKSTDVAEAAGNTA